MRRLHRNKQARDRAEQGQEIEPVEQAAEAPAVEVAGLGQVVELPAGVAPDEA